MRKLTLLVITCVALGNAHRWQDGAWHCQRATHQREELSCVAPILGETSAQACLCKAGHHFDTTRDIPDWADYTCTPGMETWACSDEAKDRGRSKVETACCVTTTSTVNEVASIITEMEGYSDCALVSNKVRDETLEYGASCKLADGYGLDGTTEGEGILTLKRTTACPAFSWEPKFRGCNYWEYQGSKTGCTGGDGPLVVKELGLNGSYFDATETIAKNFCGGSQTWNTVLKASSQLMVLKPSHQVHLQTAGREKWGDKPGTYMIIEAHGRPSNSDTLCKMRAGVQVYLCESKDAFGNCNCQDAEGNDQLIQMAQQAALTEPMERPREKCGKWFVAVSSLIQAVMVNIRADMMTLSTDLGACIATEPRRFL